MWTTDEGLGGVVAHVANDGPEPLTRALRVALYRDFEQRVDEAIASRRARAARPRRAGTSRTLLGHFVDASWAYRFGPPAQDVIVVSLESGEREDSALISQAMRFPAGRPTAMESATRLGLQANAQQLPDGTLCLRVRTGRLAYGVCIHIPGFTPSDDAFSVEPGAERVVRLLAQTADATFLGGALTAINLRGQVPVAHNEQTPTGASPAAQDAGA